MRKLVFVVMLVAATGSTLLIAALATAGGGTSNFDAKGGLSGFQEVPAVSTNGGGSFDAQLTSDGAIDWTLSYNLEGSVQQAHIHFAQKSVNGGITVFLCTNLGNGPAGTQPCPAAPATISGTIEADDVSPNIPATAAARAQGINTGEFEELVRAVRAGATYANVHSTTWPGGEIRGQLADPDGK